MIPCESSSAQLDLSKIFYLILKTVTFVLQQRMNRSTAVSEKHHRK